ncbi:hemolysin-type calcium-binding protein [Nostoc sp. NIES-4103]|nr:hemolysin-type calcium-binding protein [Nostoc sp. NIES-4103]
MLTKQQVLKFGTAFALSVLPLTVATKPTTAANLVFNGSFESPIGSAGGYGIFPSIPGWSLLTGSQGRGIEVQNNIVGSPFDGSQLVELDSNGVTGIYQDLNTIVGQKYTLEFAFSPRPRVPQNILNVNWGGNLVTTLTANGTGLTNTSWQTFTYSLVATSSVTRLSFDNLNELSNSLGTYIDKVSVTAVVPEPSTVGGSLAAVGFVWLMKRKKAASQKA